MPTFELTLILLTSHLSLELKHDQERNIGKLFLPKLLLKYRCDSLISKEKLGFSVTTKIFRIQLEKNYAYHILIMQELQRMVGLIKIKFLLMLQNLILI